MILILLFMFYSTSSFIVAININPIDLINVIIIIISTYILHSLAPFTLIFVLQFHSFARRISAVCLSICVITFERNSCTL